MDGTVEVSVSPRTAAKLLLSSEIDLSKPCINPHDSQEILNSLFSFSMEDILKIVDCNLHGSVAEVKYIPQFGKLETVANVPLYFYHKGSLCADYAQLGFYLKPDINASLTANTKFGENHGKAAAILGIADCVDRRIIPSPFSATFCELKEHERIELVKRLLFRIPLVQILLSQAKNGTINGYAPMSLLKESTRRRRSQTMRNIFDTLSQYHNSELDSRIKNIMWIDT